MPRIRSIKPDFFTSETIARLGKGTRLTFIGLWTHVDDNGVCVLNEMLITAALYPLDDPMESLADVQEDLMRLSGEGLVTLYRHAGKRYLYVNSWDEHQRVQHPGKSRYPRPTVEGCEPLTSGNNNPHESLMRLSVVPHESLTPEQGIGSREQGENTPASASPTLDCDQDDTATPSTHPNRRWGDADIDADPHFKAFWSAYPRKTDKGHARKAWLKALRERKAPPEAITAGARTYAADPHRAPSFTAHAATWLNGERWADQRETINRRPQPWEA